jgi:hypothetical protein
MEMWTLLRTAAGRSALIILVLMAAILIARESHAGSGAGGYAGAEDTTLSPSDGRAERR